MRLEDSICPICLHILVHPVTMPCDHELCLPCFEENVQQANFCCPCCRMRISSWARKKTRTNSLVNQQKWEDIQKNFPAQVKRRLEGNDDEDDEEMNALNISIKLAEPGEIRNEYLQQLKALQEQRAEERRKEMEASERLIKQLQEEERKKEAQLMALEREDEQLAKQLSQVQGENADVRTRSSVSNEIDSMPSTDTAMKNFITRLQEESQLEIRSESKSPYPYGCLTPINSGGGKICSDKDKAQQLEDHYMKRKLRKDKNLITTTDVEKLELSFSKARSKTASSTEIAIPELPLPAVKSSSPSTLTNTLSTASLHQSEILDQMSTDVCINLVDEESNSSDILCISTSPDTGQEMPRSISSHSIDSISMELNHFRPIRSCPLTPPRRLPSGKVVEPKLIRTTPRNLSGSGFTSPVETNLSDIDAGSPVMQRRLSQLADERKDQVERLSKSTNTAGVISPNENENPEKSDVSRQVTFTNTGNRATELKDISNSPLTTHDKNTGCKMIIPLEPDLDSEWMPTGTSYSPLTILKSTPDPQISESKKELKFGKLSLSRKGKTTKVKYSSDTSQSSLMNWIKKGDSVCLNSNGSGDGIECNGRDNNDEDICLSTNDYNNQKRSRRHTTMYKNPDFVYENCTTNSKDQLSVSLEGSGDFFISGNVRKRKASDSKSSPQKKLKTSEKPSILKAQTKSSSVKAGLKKTKTSLHAGKLARSDNVKSVSKPVRTMHDFFSNCNGDEIESDDESLNQEERDHRIALKLQKQFEYEHKFGLNTLRLKGTEEEYSLRKTRNRKAQDV
ncbi:hypothetical protein ACF0H5_020797 [Mactra antiquata]